MLFWCNAAFAGCIQGNCTNGQGTYTFANGDKYVGEFKDGKGHGQGTATWADGEKYVGEFKDGKKHGQGTITFANGEKYVGEWKNGKNQTTTKVTKSYTPTTNSYEEAFNIKTTWWDSIVWFFEDLFESDESEKDKEIVIV